MDVFLGGLPVWAFAVACAITFLGGFVKGAIGFALPLIMIALLPSVMPAQTALAALILPVLVTNLHQAMRLGRASALGAVRKFWRLIAASMIGIGVSAPFAVLLPQTAMFLLLGAAVLVFSTLQLSGWAPVIPPRHLGKVEGAIGLIAGLFGGISGVWGPPTIVYLLAARVEKREMVQVMNMVFALGSVMLLIMHLRTGVMNAQTFPLSVAMLVPATLGLFLGYVVQDRLEADRFRRYTLIVLIISAFNLLRRGLLG